MQPAQQDHAAQVELAQQDPQVLKVFLVRQVIRVIRAMMDKLEIPELQAQQDPKVILAPQVQPVQQDQQVLEPQVQQVQPVQQVIQGQLALVQPVLPA